MIFDTIYNFFVQILGQTQIATDIGGIYATYGTYILITMLIVGIFSVVFGLFRLVANIFCRW